MFRAHVLLQPEAPATYIMNHHVRHLRLSNPVQAYQFALFLFRLKREEEKLLAKFNKPEVGDKLANDLRTGKWGKWCKKHVSEYYPETKSKTNSPTESVSTAVGGSLPSVQEEHEDNESDTTVCRGTTI